MATTTKPSRKHWRIVLPVTVLFMVAVIWFVAWPAYERQRAIEEIEDLGGTVQRASIGPAWLNRWGIALGHVDVVNVEFTELRDEQLEHIGDLTEIEELWLGYTAISDTGLRHLVGLSKLQALYLHEARVSDEGLKCIGHLTTLDWLELDTTDISDEGLQHLTTLTNLKALSLCDTRISDNGVKHLCCLVNLQYLILSGSHVTDDGVKQLQDSLPNCEIEWSSTSQ